MDGKRTQMIIDNFDEMLAQSMQQPLVMGIALHPISQPAYRLRHHGALQHIARHNAIKASGSPRRARSAATWTELFSGDRTMAAKKLPHLPPA
jgi:hypothetical protein